MFARMNCGPVRSLSRLTEFALRVFVVKLLMGSISHNASPAVQIKIEISAVLLPAATQMFSGQDLFANQLIYKQLVAGQ